MENIRESKLRMLVSLEPPQQSETLVDSEASAFMEHLDDRDSCPLLYYYSPIQLTRYLLGSGTAMINKPGKCCLHEAFSITVAVDQGFSPSALLTFCAG